MEDDTERVSDARCARGSRRAAAFTRYTPRVPVHGPVVDGEHHGVALTRAATTSGATACAAAAPSDEFTAVEIAPGLGQQNATCSGKTCSP